MAKDSENSSDANFRWLLLAASIILIVSATSFRYATNFDDSTKFWIFNIVTKVAILLFATALAWTQLQYLARAKYGRIVLVALLVAAGFLLIRPKAMTALLPLIAVATLLIFTVTFLKDFFKTP